MSFQMMEKRKKMMRIINWINYHEYENNERNDWKKESSTLVDMGSRKG